MLRENPARSGDQKEIAWMVKSKDDFYYEDYSTVSAQCSIISEALTIFGDTLRVAALTPTNKWLRNVRAYLCALDDGQLDQLWVQDTRGDGDVDMQSVLQDAAFREGQMEGDLEPSVSGEMGVDDGAGPGEEEEADDMCAVEQDSTVRLRPRTKKFFYERVLKGMRMWHRPPHNHCNRCGDFEKAKGRLLELNAALLSNVGDAEHARHSAVVARSGGSAAGWKECRKLQLSLPDLTKHVNWKNEARPYLKTRQMGLKWWEALWQLDYGGLNDSANEKVAVWSVTVMAPNRPQENFDYFFDQANAKSPAGAGAAKKDGQTGIFFLDDMLDPAKSPYNDGVCLYKHFYPDNSHIIASGDTGNGYRAYAMLENMSHIHEKFGYTVELSPLAPGHAWNRTDARIAHMNTFLGALKAVTRVFGALGVSREFHKASDMKLKNQRKYMARSHIFHRDVHVDHDKAEDIRKNIGCMLQSEDLDGGRMGVRGLLYFDFFVLDEEGVVVHPPGYARVREHPDPARADNPTRVYTWRKDLAALMCQQCSDRLGGPVALTLSGCTKKGCAVDKENKRVMEEEAAARLRPEMPLLGSDPLDEEVQEGAAVDRTGSVRERARDPVVGGNKKQKKAPKWEKSVVTRQVRAVQGVDRDGAEKLWFYVPENTGDASKTQRKGWWLHEDQNSDGRYYIGPLEDIQQTKDALITDLAKCDAFPFKRVVQIGNKGKEVPKTVRCTTDKKLSMQSLLEEPITDLTAVVDAGQAAGDMGPAAVVDAGQNHKQKRPARKRAEAGQKQLQRNSRPRRKA